MCLASECVIGRISGLCVHRGCGTMGLLRSEVSCFILMHSLRTEFSPPLNTPLLLGNEHTSGRPSSKIAIINEVGSS